ncbi:hypothetical protein A8709_30300 [Paenibacillus pectinilyticus]|uniref:3-isopropylmalate dehydratase n=1 Tax=Paenibacillus pectinilyticus TaxID=512399 RepID=A0A1C0ZVK8_9BACL|nr:hypothetical protein [Paenibacillus pectinilyticus]OCT12146.1 hypothetical protein A8709_30300 [Paenibacillus pectinilyticus]
MSIQFKGNAITLQGDNLNLDTAMGWYLGMDALPPTEIAAKFMSGINQEIAPLVKQGDILIGGKNFGFGKVHGAFMVAIGVLGIKCIVAESFSTQLLQIALMTGVAYLVECPGVLDGVDMGDEIEVDINNSVVVNKTKSTTIACKEFSPFLIDVMNSGGHIKHLAKKVAERNSN